MAHRISKGMALVAGIACIMPAAPVAAQAFPTKPIRFVIPFPAGSSTEAIYRPLVEHLGATLGQSVLIDPKPGSGSMVASLHVKSQPPDGHTVYVVTNTAVTKSLLPNPEIDVRSDFAHIVALNDSPLIIAVNSELIRVTTVRELVEEARRRPGELNYASTGIGSGAHLFIELLASEAKIKLTHIPYTGTAQGTADAAVGRVQLTGTVLGSLIPHIASLGGSGRLRMIAVSTSERWPLARDVPGMKESGFPQLTFAYWGAVVGPKGMPRNIVETFNRAINAALKDPKIGEHLTRQGQTVIGGTPEDLTRMISREYDGYAKLIKDTGLKLE